jgi:acetoacetyl-CoA synthetase
MTAFTRFCEVRVGRRFPDYAAFHRFSVSDFRLVWRLFFEWSGLRFDGGIIPACTDDSCEQALFFPNLRLNYAESVLQRDERDAKRPALTACSGELTTTRLTRGELRDRVRRASAALQALDIEPGDRVVAMAGNTIETVVAALAVTAVGAVFATSAPEMGATTVIARFDQLEPELLLCHLRSPQRAAPRLIADRVSEVARALPSLRAVVALDDGPDPDCALPVLRWSEIVAAAPSARPWPRLPFNHPCFILFSSGTTGRPKCLIHGAGGTLLEHVKEHRLHCDLRAGDKLFFHTSTAWMMWHWQLSALASGAEIVLYDGPLTDPGALWRLVSREQVTVFGTSPAYLQLCQDAGVTPGRDLPLASLRAVLSTGSVLHDGQYDWLLDSVKPVPLQSISGGTDIIGCFVLGNPNLPVHRGEIQCRSLCLDVQAQPGATKNARIGELVCRNPFPSRPLGLYGDADGARFHAAYFNQNPGIWTHGDFIEFSEEGTARIHGRSDGVLNIRGIRIGPAEIYRILRSIPEVREAVALEQTVASKLGDSRMVLLVKLRHGAILDGALAVRIKKELGRRGSPAHVPDIIAQVRALPLTHSGKVSASAVGDAINGRAVVNLGALSNPECLEAIKRHPALAPIERVHEEPARLPPELPLVLQLQAIWERIFGLVPIGFDDNFFDLGGRSLLAFILFDELKKLTGRTFPVTTIFEAPTINALAMRLEDFRPVRAFSCLVRLRLEGADRPLFIVHGFGGNVLELAKLARFLRCDRPIYALQARGLDPAQEPHDRIEDMAENYLSEIREVQPHGPYALAGFSTGGLIAFEMANRLVGCAELVEFVGLLDTEIHEHNLPLAQSIALQLSRTMHVIGRMRSVSPSQGIGYMYRMARLVLDRLRLRVGQQPHQRLQHEDLLPPHFVRVRDAGRRAFAAYEPGFYPGLVTLFRARERHPLGCDPLPLWRAVAAEVEVVDIPGTHVTFIEEPNVQVLGEEMGLRLMSATEVTLVARSMQRKSALAANPTHLSYTTNAVDLPGTPLVGGRPLSPERPSN